MASMVAQRLSSLMLLRWLLCCTLLLMIDRGESAVPTVTPDNGPTQIAVTPNSFTLSFTVTPTVPPSGISWFLGTNNITNDLGQFRQLSADRLNLTISIVTSSDEGIFRLVATNSFGSGEASVSVSVQSEPGFQEVPDENIKIHERLNTTFKCFAVGIPTPDINWLFNDSQIIPDGIKHSIGPFGDVNFGSLTITDLEYADAGVYTCVANNTHRTASVLTTLEVQVFPVITVQPLSANITAGSNDIITCTARGFPFTDIYWRKNSQNITDIQSSAIAIYNQLVSNPNTEDLTVIGTLNINGSVLSTSGNFSCVATNYLVTFEEEFSNEVEIFIQYPPSTISVDKVTVNQTDPAVFNCSTFGIPPPIILWYSSLDPDTPITNSGGAITIEYSSYINETGLIIKTSTLSISTTSRTLHEANYTCLASNGITNLIGTPEGGVTELIVQVPPSLRPVNDTNNILAIVTDTVTLAIVIDDASPGVLPGNIVWEFNTFNSSIAVQTLVSDSQFSFSDNRLSLIISYLTHDNEGYYTITTTNEAGIDTLQLTLNVEAAPNITIFPVDINVLLNNNATLTCGATSEPPHTVQWLKGDTVITNDNIEYTISRMDGEIERENVSILTVLYSNMNDTADYTCVVSNIHGVQNHTAHLEVQVPPVLLNIRDDSNNTIIGIDNETINITCQYFGSPIPDIMWFNDSVSVILTTDISVVTNVEGFVRSSTLVFSNLDFFDDGRYTCLGSNTLFDQQNTSSSNISLIINRPPLLVFPGLTVVVNQSQNLNINCSFLSRPIPSIIWTTQDSPSSPIKDNDKYNIFIDNIIQLDGVSILTTSILEIIDLNELDSRDYICTATNKPRGPLTQNQSTNNTQTVIVQTSPIVTRLSNEVEIGVKGNQITLNFTITRDLPLVIPDDGIQWYHTNDNGLVQIVNSSRHLFDDKITSLTITNLTLTDQGIYSLNASNIIGTGSDMIFLDVQRSPMITNTSGVVRQVFGFNAFLECVAVSEPVHISRWLFNESELSDPNKYLIQGNGTTNSNITIYNITTDDEGYYTCQVDNAHGADEESSLLLVQVPPTITQQPIDKIVLVTNTVSLVCCASGTPVPIISWFKESERVSNNSRITVYQTGQCGTLTITNATLSDTTLYQCVANNTLAIELTISSNTANIVVQYPPEVYSLDRTTNTHNETDEFMTECQAFGVPLPTIYWIPSPLKDTLGSPEEQLLFANNVEELLASVVNFNGSRLIGAESRCVGMGSGSGMANSSSHVSNDSCVYDTGTVNDCTLNGSLCSVPCVVNIDSNDNMIDSQGRNIRVSRLRICSLLKSDELSYTCVAVNNITNVLNTSKGAYTNLIVQVPPKVLSLEEEDPLTAFRNRNVSLDFKINRASPDVVPVDIIWTFASQRLGRNEQITIPTNDSHYEFSSDRRSLKIVQLNTNDAGTYTLTSRNPAGIAFESITLDVQALPDIEIVSPPMEVQNNDTVILSCFADGSPIQDVHWTLTDQARGGIQLYTIRYIIDNTVNRTGHIEYIPLVDDIDEDFIREKFTISPPDLSVSTRLYGQLTIKNITPFEAGAYNCTLINKFDHSNATITVDVQLNPRIVQGPIDTTCVIGQSCELFCLVEGVPSPVVTFRKDNNILIEENNVIELIETVNNYTNKGLTLNIIETQLSNVGVYTCRGNNSLVTEETIESNDINLTVHSPATIVSHLSDTIGNETFSTSFTCSVTGIPEPTIRWFRDESEDIVTDTDKYTINTTGVVGQFGLITVTSNLVISNLTKLDELTYSCMGQNNVENVIGANDLSVASLTVQVPPTVISLDIIQPAIVLNGSMTTISFNITRASPPVQLTNIQWSFVHVNNTKVTLDPNCVLSGANCSDERYLRYNFTSDLLTLTIYSTRVADYGRFSLTATNEAGTNTESYNVSVQVPPQLLYSSGGIIKLNESDTLILNCSADGIPRPTIVWFSDSSSIDIGLRPRTNENKTIVPSFRTLIATVPVNNGYMSTLIINDVLKSTEQAEFVCVASNGVGSTVSLLQPYSVSVTEIVIDFCASTPCENGGTCSLSVNGFVCACVVTDEVQYGGQTCNQRSIIRIPPSFTQRPSDSFINLFQPVELNCAADGQPSPTIRWLKDGVDTGVTGNSFIIPEVTLSDRGNYSCVAKNLPGEITSKEAIVNILDIVQYTANLTVQFNQILAGTNLTTAGQSVIDKINTLALGQSVNADDSSNTTFFAINIFGTPLNNTKNITIPIVVTIRTRAGQRNDVLRQDVQNAVSSFGFELQINSQVTLFDRCPVDRTILSSPDGDPSLDLTFMWPETVLGKTVTMGCPCNLTFGSFRPFASRTCGGNFVTGADWNFAQDSRCDFSITARRMCLLAASDDGGVILIGLRELTQASGLLGSTEIGFTSFLLQQAGLAAEGNITLTESAADIYDSTLKANESSRVGGEIEFRSQSRILENLNNVTNSLPTGTMIMRDTLVIMADQVMPDQGDVDTDQLFPTIPRVTLTANLSELTNNTNNTQMNQLNRTVTAFADDGLYIERDRQTRIIQSPILDYTIVGLDVTNLKNPINITFSRNTTDDEDIACVFWSLDVDDGFGRWETEGCKTIRTATSLTCLCNHLTSFSILLDVAADQTPPPEEDLAFSLLTYIGISISIICILITIFTYLYSAKLRKSEGNQLLVNLCFALLGLYLTFFLAAQGSKITTFICAIVGALLHYFLLVVFFVMAAEAIDLFIKLVIVLGSTIQHYIKKAVIIAWILPLFIVPFTISPHYNNYVHDHYCGATGPALYVGVLVPFFVVYIFNNTIFFIIMASLLKKSGSKNFADAKRRNRKQETKQHCRVAFTISILFGLGWGFGLLASQAIDVAAIRIIFSTLFTVFIAFQGFFIFLLYIVLSPNAKKEWKRWLLRKEDKGAGSSSVSGTGRSKSTGSTGVKKSAASYKNYNKKRSGTLYHNVYSQQNKSTNLTFNEELTSGAFNSDQPVMMDELKYNIENDKTFMNPLDQYEDTFSMLSEHDTQSVNNIEVSSFPNPNPPLSLEDGFESASLTAEDEEDGGNINCTTLDNPFLSVRGKNISVDADDMESLSQDGGGGCTDAGNNHAFSFDLSSEPYSQGLSEGTFSENKDLIKSPVGY